MAEQVDTYKIPGDIEVTIFKIPNQVKYLYFTLPPEFKLTEAEFTVLDQARQVMVRHKPQTEELLDPERIRANFAEIGADLISEFCKRQNISLRPSRIDILAEILTRETAGFGILEVLLMDQKVQDISINSPPGITPIYLFHSEYEDCVTNIIPTREESESWATRLRLESGRPLDQANPVLDTAIHLPHARARVCAITKTLSPFGIAYSVRRHRTKPWTTCLFIDNRMMTSLCAGLLSFFVDGARTILIAGTRGAGKSSFLGAILVEIMRRYRIITIEDTLELPVVALRKLGYNIQSLQAQSAIISVESELSPAAAIRTSLRLGDSALILGEVRSKETLALYEAMRVGALANVVAGTIHGDSPYGVFDRVVNDLGVPKTSFKATDIIFIVNPLKSADGLHKFRRITQVSEVRKHWEEDPIKEKGFEDLMVYDAKQDKLVPTPVLLDGESEILSEISAKVRDWVGNFDAVWENITLRARYKQEIVNIARKTGLRDLLEAEFVIRANDMFHLICNEVSEELGGLEVPEIWARWNTWFRETVRKEAEVLRSKSFY
jgi:type IV secretory pathway ATPase VirB11/archaellum biosynthesis ATPase